MANKKINAYYDSSKKIIVIDEDNVQKGDYIDVANDSIATQIFNSQLTNEIKQKIILEYKNSSDYNNLIKEYDEKIKLLIKDKDDVIGALNIANGKLSEQDDKIKKERDNAVLEFQNTTYRKLENEYNNLKNQNANIQNELQSIANKTINEFKASDEFMGLKLTIQKLEVENKSIPLKTIEEFKKSAEYLDLKDKADRRSKLNSKSLGENLETYCQKEYEDKLQLFDNTSWSKTTIARQGKKPDFIFTVYTNNKKDVEIASIVLEMKTSASNQANNKINQHLDALENNRVNFNAEFALLVTDLELDSENDFILKKAADKSRIFIVRPQYFTYVLILFKIIYEKSSELANFLKKGSVDKEQILNFIDEFKKFKEDLFTKSIKNIQANLTDIIQNANKIKDYAEDILKSVSTITNTHLKATENKINNYLKKIINKEDNFKEEN